MIISWAELSQTQMDLVWLRLWLTKLGLSLEKKFSYIIYITTGQPTYGEFIPEGYKLSWAEPNPDGLDLAKLVLGLALKIDLI